MTTISKAKTLAEQGGDYNIKAKLVTRQVFTKRRDGELCKLLVEVLVDQEGRVIELKSWSTKKIYTVYRKFAPNYPVLINASCPFREPNRKYSQSEGDLYGRWFMNETDDFKMKKHIACYSNIASYCQSNRKPSNLVGLYQEHVPGPVCKTTHGHVLAYGYYVRLLDDQSRLFQALVWHNPYLEKGSKFSLSTCCENKDVVLIVFAREQDSRYTAKTSGYYTVTTTYPTAINPDCVNPQTQLSLKRNRTDRVIKFDPQDYL